MKKIDAKLRNIRAGNYTRADFMIADAKDADMGGGIGMAGPRRRPDGSADGMRTRRDYLDAIKAVVAQDIIDISLVSASNLEVLDEEGVFAHSGVQPAIRANETTDVWGGLRHGKYAIRRSIPHRSAVLPHAGTDLGLYSITFNNEIESDLRTLEAFKDFRAEARAAGFRYFLEVFNPNAPVDLDSSHDSAISQRPYRARSRGRRQSRSSVVSQDSVQRAGGARRVGAIRSDARRRRSRRRRGHDARCFRVALSGGTSRWPARALRP